MMNDIGRTVLPGFEGRMKAIWRRRRLRLRHFLGLANFAQSPLSPRLEKQIQLV